MEQVIWNWAILGAVLVGLELMTGTFYILCLGIAAFLLSLVLAVLPVNLGVQLILFIIFSAANLSIWHLKFKTKTTDLLIGQSNDGTVGQIGTVSEVSGQGKYIVKFETIVLGSRSWTSLSTDELEVGDEVIVTSIEGNNLRIKQNKG